MKKVIVNIPANSTYTINGQGLGLTAICITTNQVFVQFPDEQTLHPINLMNKYEKFFESFTIINTSPSPYTIVVYIKQTESEILPSTVLLT